MLAAETEAATPPPPMPADREARERLAVMELAREIRTLRGAIPDPGAVVETALEQTWSDLLDISAE